MTRHYLFAGIVCLGFFTCGTTATVDPDSPAPATSLQTMRSSFGSLEGDWVLTNYKNNPLPTALQNRATLVLKKENTDRLDVGGRSFINHYGGSFSLDETKGLVVSTDGLFSTKMGGSPEAMQAENAYYAHLEKATYFELADNGQLLLYAGPKDDTRTEVLYFTRT